jgi:hypothetical protein
LEDSDGKKLAFRRNVPRMSTAMLAAEMVAAGHIGEADGFRVYDAATPARVRQAEWNVALIRATAALPPAESES